MKFHIFLKNNPQKNTKHTKHTTKHTNSVGFFFGFLTLSPTKQPRAPGIYEALELRDGDKMRLLGKGVQKAKPGKPQQRRSGEERGGREGWFEMLLVGLVWFELVLVGLRWF